MEADAKGSLTLSELAFHGEQIEAFISSFKAAGGLDGVLGAYSKQMSEIGAALNAAGGLGSIFSGYEKRMSEIGAALNAAGGLGGIFSGYEKRMSEIGTALNAAGGLGSIFAGYDRISEINATFTALGGFDDAFREQVAEISASLQVVKGVVSGADTVSELGVLGDFARQIIPLGASFAPLSEGSLSQDDSANVVMRSVSTEDEADSWGEWETGDELDHYLSALVSVFGRALDACKSLRDVQNLFLFLGLVISLLSLWYSHQSATSADIAAQTAVIERGQHIEMDRLAVERERLAVEKERLSQGRAEKVGAELTPTDKILEAWGRAHDLAVGKVNNLPSVQRYEVERPTRLTREKRFKSDALELLSPGEIVEVIQRSGKWLKVECRKKPEAPKQGWVLKKYMKKIKQ